MANTTNASITKQCERRAASGENTKPSNDDLQRTNVGAVVRQAGIDVWAFEEINDPADWQLLLADVAAEGYLGVLGPSVSSTPDFDLRLGFIYNPAVISLIQTRTILTQNASRNW